MWATAVTVWVGLFLILGCGGADDRTSDAITEVPADFVVYANHGMGFSVALPPSWSAKPIDTTITTTNVDALLTERDGRAILVFSAGQKVGETGVLPNDPNISVFVQNGKGKNLEELIEHPALNPEYLFGSGIQEVVHRESAIDVDGRRASLRDTEISGTSATPLNREKPNRRWVTLSTVGRDLFWEITCEMSAPASIATVQACEDSVGSLRLLPLLD